MTSTSRAKLHGLPALAGVVIVAAIVAGHPIPAAAGKKPKPPHPSGKEARKEATSKTAVQDPVAILLTHVRDLLDAGQADSAIAALKPRLAASAADRRLTRALVIACNAAGTPWEGVRIIEEIIRLRPNDVHPGLLNLYVALGEIELQRRRPEVAIRHFQRSILLDDSSPDALGGFGRCRAHQGGRIDPAITYLDKLAKAKPNNAAARYGKAVLLLEAGRADESVPEFRWAIGLDDKSWLTERDYGRALVRLGDRDGAIAHFETAVRLLDESGDPLMAERVAEELRAAGEGAGDGTAPPKKEEPRG